MGAPSRRRFLSGLVALGIGSVSRRGLAPELARAARSAPFAFDISASQFAADWSLAGGEFADWGDGEYGCYFHGWRMECSKRTHTCRITCDAGVKCVKSKRLPGQTLAALHAAAMRMAPARK
jgi:hypothetical protein